MGQLYDVRYCRNCGTSFAWLRKDITKGLRTIITWDQALREYGVKCCDHPEMNNDVFVGHFFLEA